MTKIILEHKFDRYWIEGWFQLVSALPLVEQHFAERFDRFEPSQRLPWPVVEFGCDGIEFVPRIRTSQFP